MLDRRKLNGWQRLWLVFAVGTFVYAVGWALLQGTAGTGVDPIVSSGFDNPRCRPIVQMPAGTSLVAAPPFEDPCWSVHFYRSIHDDAATTREQYVSDMHWRRSMAILISLGIAIAIWFVAVSVLYVAGLVIAWVVGGFRQAR